MKKIIVLFLIAGMMALPGCGSVADTVLEQTDGSAEDSAPLQTGGNAEDTGKQADEENEAADEETALEGKAEESKEGKESSAEDGQASEAENGSYTWQEITVTLPEGWDGRCVMVENENGFSVYQKASYEEDGTLGYICGFYRTRELVEDGNGEMMIAYTEGGTLYYLTLPMDVACDTENEKITEEYVRMCQQTPQLKASMQIAAFDVHYNADEYVLPASSILGLDQETLEYLSDNNLWIAENEIYARHGSLFDDAYLQQYFNRCTWYKGEIPAEEFQESSLSQTEKDNLKLLAAARQEYARRHPYPKMYQAAETATEDLSGDGKADEISYQVVKQGNGEYQCRITVNGEVYIADELARFEFEVGMTNPVMDCFYITDILEDDGALEIAVLDEGPSEDPVTYFFQYDGTLTCIGQVPGVPFADMNGGFNGFNGFGGIIGHQRIDLIETAYLQDYWRYDGDRIIYMDLGWYDFLPTYGHILYEDLPVYCEREVSSGVFVIPAQEEVYFLGSDLYQWILVKGKDGSMGYMLVGDGNIVELDKPADQVFSDLYFFD